MGVLVAAAVLVILAGVVVLFLIDLDRARTCKLVCEASSRGEDDPS